MATENEMILAWQQTGCVKSRDAVIQLHIGAVKKKAYSLPCPRGVEREDLISEGMIGLIEAIDKFDITKGIKFITYAWAAFTNAMFDYVAKNSGRGISYYAKSNGIAKLLYCVGNLTHYTHKGFEKFSKEKGIPMSDLMAFHNSGLSPIDSEDFWAKNSFVKKVEEEDVLQKAITLLETKCNKYERAAIQSQITEDFTIGQIADSVGRTRQGMRDTYARTIGYLREKLA